MRAVSMPRGLEDLVTGDVAPDAGEAVRRDAAVDGMVDFDDDERNAGAVEDARGRPSAAAVAGDDHVIAQGFGERLDWRGGAADAAGAAPRASQRQSQTRRRAATGPW